MTPAERARQIDAQEFRRESEPALARALEYSRNKRWQERLAIINFIAARYDPPAPKRTEPKKSTKPAAIYEYRGDRRTLDEWAAFLQISRAALDYRIARHGFTAAIELGSNRDKRVTVRSKPVQTYTYNGKTMTRDEWAAYLGITPNTFSKRVSRCGSVVEAIRIGEGNQHHRCGRRKGSKNRGVSPNFVPLEGTGAGSTARETAQIDFPEKAINE